MDRTLLLREAVAAIVALIGRNIFHAVLSIYFLTQFRV